MHRVVMRAPAFTCELAADSVVVPMHLIGGHIGIDVMVEGKGPFLFLFDTGASGSVMDLEFAKRQGLALGSEIMVGSPNGGGRPGRMVKLDTLRVGGLATHGMTSVAFDGMPFPPGPDAPRGVIGPYGMAGLLVTLDYPHQRLVFRRGALPPPDGKEVLGWDRSRPLPEIPATLAGKPVFVHLDSGAPGGLGMPVAFEGKLRMMGPLVEMGRAKTVDRDVATRGAKLDGDFVIGRWTLEKPTVRFSEVLRDVGNVGTGILRQFAITIDPANARLRLVGPSNGRSRRPSRNRSAEGLRAGHDALSVGRIPQIHFSDSPHTATSFRHLPSSARRWSKRHDPPREGTECSRRREFSCWACLRGRCAMRSRA